MSKTLSVIFDGEVFRPETPTDLVPNTRYEITLQPQPVESISDNKFKLLDQNYDFTDRSGVEDYLSQHSALIPLLEEAFQPIKGYFPAAVLSLRVGQILEGIGENRLFITIHTKGEEYQVQRTYNRLKSEWWFKFAAGFLNEVSVAIDHPEFSTQQSIKDMTALAGSVEAPADWSLEHDHYLYGTPKAYSDQNDG